MKTGRPLLQLSILIALSIFVGSCASSKAFRTAEKKLLSEKSIRAAHIGISLFDPASGKFIYNYQGDKYFVPASNTKLPTCYAAMKYLGDSLAAFRYFTAGEDTIVFAGVGNPDFLHPDFKQQRAYSFLKKFKHIFFASQGYKDFLGSGWSWSDYKDYYMAQRSDFPMYGNMALFQWHGPDKYTVTPSYFLEYTNSYSQLLEGGFEVGKDFDENRFTIAKGTARTAELPFTPDMNTVAGLLFDTLHIEGVLSDRYVPKNALLFKSRPVDSVLTPMMHRSDNFFAEQMLLMVSQEKLGVMNDEKIIDTLLKTDFASMPQKPRWVDGSGLSRYNLFTPQDFVFILDKMQSEFGMERIKKILPTGGEGTISNYYQQEAGQIFAKTGTLSGVVAFSGYVYTKAGKLLIFSILVNNNTAQASDVRHAVEAFIREVRELK